MRPCWRLPPFTWLHCMIFVHKGRKTPSEITIPPHMFIPFIPKSSRKLFIRKGGGGGGGGHGGGGRGGGSSRGGGGSVKSNTGAVAKGSPNLSGASRSPVPINSAGQSFKATPFGNGGGAKSTIPLHQPFSGRQVGGGTRSQVYGTS